MKADLATFMARDDFLTGHQKMDHLHQEFYELLEQLRQASQANAAACLLALIGHCKEHFGQEDQWIAESKYRAGDCHVQEHAQVLASLEEVHSRLCNDDHRALPRLIEALESWFPGHVQHLDSALAHWLADQQWKAQPIVFRRGAANSAPATS